MIQTIYSDPNSLSHHGVKGMHWGVRRYQNKNGSLTLEGQKHLSKYQDYKKLEYEQGQKVAEAFDRFTGKKGSYHEEFGYGLTDDHELWDLVMMEILDDRPELTNGKLEIEANKAFYNATTITSDFYRNNSESINIGRQLSNSGYRIKNK